MPTTTRKPKNSKNQTTNNSEISIEANKLSEILKLCGTIANENKSDSKVIQIEPQGDRLIFSATNLTYSIEYSHQANIATQPSILVDSKNWSAIVSQLEGELLLNLASDKITIQQLSSSYSLQTIKDSLVLNRSETQPLVSLDSNFLKLAIEKISFCVSKNLKEIISGINFEFTKDRLLIRSLSPHLSGQSCVAVSCPTNTSFTLPAKAAMFIAKNATGLVEIEKNDKAVRFFWEERKFCCTVQTLQAAYPNFYIKTVEEQNQTVITFKTEELLKRVKRHNALDNCLSIEISTNAKIYHSGEATAGIDVIDCVSNIGEQCINLDLSSDNLKQVLSQFIDELIEFVIDANKEDSSIIVRSENSPVKFALIQISQ
jgi:DNA polymerase III sliding clamp (beta) subunit (PCNA family)